MIVLEALLNDLENAKIQLDSAVEDLQEFITKGKKHSYNMGQLQSVIVNAADVSSLTELSLEDLDMIDDDLLKHRLKG